MVSDPFVKLLLFRHGETDANKDGRFLGRLDVPLNENGIQQAHRLSSRLSPYTVQALYSSPALRARHTAEIVSSQWEVAMQFDDRLWEIDHKEWEGKLISDVRTEMPQLLTRWMRDEIEAPHGGESLADASHRVRSWLDDVKDNHAGTAGHIAVSAHGGILQVMLCELLGTPKRNFWPYQFRNTGIAEVWVYPEGATLLAFN